MKQEDRFVMTSAVRRLGQEISKLGLRMRNRSPSGSDSDVFNSTDELTTKVTSEGSFAEGDSCENSGASGSLDAAAHQMRQRRHSRNELDEDVECRERKSSIKAALRPVLSRKSRSDLAKYPRPNQEFNLKQETLKRNGSENSFKENTVHEIVNTKNGRSKAQEDVYSIGYRVPVESKASKQEDKTTQPRRVRRMKRSKSFSGLLGWRHGAKQSRKNTAENDAKSVELSTKVLRRTNSFSTVESRKSSLENSKNVTLQQQAFTTPDIQGTQQKYSSKLPAEIFLTSAPNEDEFPRNGAARKQSETRLSYMALKGFRYKEGMIETDLCSTEL